MTQKEKDAFDKMYKKILKHGKLVDNMYLPRGAALGDKYASTVVIPTFKFLKEINKFVKKVKKAK